MNPLVIDVGLRATILIGAAAAFTALMYRASAATRHFIWTLTIVGLMLLPVLTAAIPRWEIAVPASIAIAGPPEGGPYEDGTYKAASDVSAPTVVNDVSTTAPIRMASTPASNDVPWLMLLPIGYVAGVFFFLGRIAVQRMRARGIARNATVVSEREWTMLLDECRTLAGVERTVTLVRSRDQVMPMTIGTRTPAIVIPLIAETWDEDRRRAVLLHELAHISRVDCLTQLLAAIVCALYWIHPGAWYASRRLRIEREVACDDRVIATGTQASEYASHLLELAYTWSGRRAPALVVSMAGSRKLEGRMLALLDPTRNRTTPTRRVWMAGAVAAVLLLVPIAAVTMTAAADASPEISANASAADLIAVAGAPQTDTRADRSRDDLNATWEIRPSGNPGRMSVRFSRGDSSFGTDVDIATIRQMAPQVLNGSGPVRFSIPREPGTFEIDGTVRGGVGAGTFQFVPSHTFAAEMTKRGFAQPSASDLLSMAFANMGFAFIDELAAQGYPRPDLALLVRAAKHGINLDYLRGMSASGYRVGTVDALIKLRDHGVDPEYIRGIKEYGLTGLSADDLVRARDHGIDSRYVSELKNLGFASLPLDTLVRTRDHGIDPNYINSLRQLGYRLDLEGLVKARDHGVDAPYVSALTAAGYTTLTIDDLVRVRDHGVDPNYIREMRRLGYTGSLEDLIKARDHGIDPPYIDAMAAVGFKGLPMESLIRLRDHGVTPDYVEKVKKREKNPTVDDLIRFRDQGVASNQELDFKRMLQRAHMHLSALAHEAMSFFQ